MTLIQVTIPKLSLAQALPSEAKLSLFVRVPKKIGQPELQVVTQNSVEVKTYLISDTNQVLAKKTQSVNIVSGSLNLSFGFNASVSCSTESGYQCAEGLQVLSDLPGSTAQEKFLHALYGTSSSISAQECYSDTANNVSSCSSSSTTFSLTPGSPRYLVVQFTVKNQSNEDVPLSFKVKAGSAFYSQYAQVAMGLQSGPDASKPASPSPGQVYIATDTKKIYWYNGTSLQWLAIGGTGDAGDITTGTLDGARLPNFSGDVSGAYNALQVTKIQGKEVAAPSPSSSNKILGINNAGDGFEYKSITAGSGVNITHSAGGIQISSTVSSATPSGAAGGDLGGNYPNPTVNALKGKELNTSGLADQVSLVFDNTTQKWLSTWIKASAIRDSTGNWAFPTGERACSAGQTWYWNAPLDRIDCRDIELHASKITVGIIDLARLPAAASGVGGILTSVAQTISGQKTFADGVTVQGVSQLQSVQASGNIETSGQIEAASHIISQGYVKVGSTSEPCNASTPERKGALRYNPTLNRLEYCDGSGWKNISSGMIASVQLSTPVPQRMASAATRFSEVLVTFGSGTDTNSINFTGKVQLAGHTAGCSTSIHNGSTAFERKIRISGCSQTQGSVTVSLLPGVALSQTGDPSPAVGPSDDVTIDNIGPTAPTVSLGTVPSGTVSETPPINLGGSVDQGGGSVDGYEVRIERVSDNAVIRDWAAHSNGQAITGLSLQSSEQYRVLARARDDYDNIGSVSAPVQWQPIGVTPGITIGSASTNRMSSSTSVTWTVTYSNTSSISLAAHHITILGDNAGCNVSVSGSGITRTISVTGCVAPEGAINLAIAAGSAMSNTNHPAPSVTASGSVVVDNLGPNAPTNIAISDIPYSLTQTPLITYNAASDRGSGNISRYEVQIEKVSDGSVVLPWITHVSNTRLGSLSLSLNTQYRVKVRAVDDVGNPGLESKYAQWTTIAYLRSCKEILDAGSSTGDGFYVIDVDLNGPMAPTSVYCEMTTNGGGWTWIVGRAEYTNSVQTLLGQISLTGVGVNYSEGQIKIYQGTNPSGPCSAPVPTITLNIQHIPHREVFVHGFVKMFNATTFFISIDVANDGNFEHRQGCTGCGWVYTSHHNFSVNSSFSVANNVTSSFVQLYGASCQWQNDNRAEMYVVKVR